MTKLVGAEVVIFILNESIPFSMTRDAEKCETKNSLAHKYYDNDKKTSRRRFSISSNGRLCFNPVELLFEHKARLLL